MVAHGVWVLPGGLSLLVTPHDLHMDLEFEDIVLTASALSPMFHLPILVMYSIASQGTRRSGRYLEDEEKARDLKSRMAMTPVGKRRSSLLDTHGFYFATWLS